MNQPATKPGPISKFTQKKFVDFTHSLEFVFLSNEECRIETHLYYLCVFCFPLTNLMKVLYFFTISDTFLV